jgi:hypothetical protein
MVNRWILIVFTNFGAVQAFNNHARDLLCSGLDRWLIVWSIGALDYNEPVNFVGNSNASKQKKRPAEGHSPRTKTLEHR